MKIFDSYTSIFYFRGGDGALRLGIRRASQVKSVANVLPLNAARCAVFFSSRYGLHAYYYRMKLFENYSAAYQQYDRSYYVSGGIVQKI